MAIYSVQIGLEKPITIEADHFAVNSLGVSFYDPNKKVIAFISSNSVVSVIENQTKNKSE